MRFQPIALATLLVALAVWGCQPDDDFPEAPISNELGNKREKLVGTWTLTKIVQIDEQARAKNWPQAVQVRTFESMVPLFNNRGEAQTIGFSTMKLTLNANDSYTFALGDVPPSMLPVSIPLTGTWGVNDDVFTTTLSLDGPTTDEIQLTIKSLAANGAPLVFGLSRVNGSTKVMSYELYFTE